MRKMAKRRWAAILMLVLSVAFLTDAVLIEPQWLEVTHLSLPLQRLPTELDGMTIAQLTDMHYPRGLPEAYFRKVVQRTNALQPDVVVLTGDYVPGLLRDLPAGARLLGELRAPLGLYAVLGNHDYRYGPGTVAQALGEVGITVLRNEAVPVRRAGKRLWIVGLDDACMGGTRIAEALKDVPAGEPTVVLVHEPDYADVVTRYPVDLQLSGHSHGGLVRIPFLGTPMCPRLSRKYPQGLRRVGPLWLYTSRGIGVIPIFEMPVRVNCRPELAIFTLKSVPPNAAGRR